MDKDIVVIGGGIIGSSIAWSLTHRGLGPRVIVLEPDPTYSRSSTTRSASAIRTQFHLGINVAMSRYGYDFYRAATEHLSLHGEAVDVRLKDCPYLVLSGPGGASRMRAAHQRQLENGADVDFLLTAVDFECVPWLKTEGISAATLGRSGEGWMDPSLALQAVRSKAESLGVTYVPQWAIGLDVHAGLIRQVHLADGTSITTDTLIDAAGALAAQVAAMASIALPVEARKRSAFVFRTTEPPEGFTNFVDPTFGGRGIYARPFQGNFLAVTSPAPEVDQHTDDLAPDLSLFHEVVRPGLAQRVVGFENLELVEAWAGHYEINTFDQNGVIGRHPEIENLVFACGFSGHGVMHAPAVGRGVSELLVDGSYQTLDLSPFRFERIAENTPLDDVQASEHRASSAGV